MPAINCIAELNIQKPVKKIMPNGMMLNIIDTGTEDVVKLDLVIGSGQLNQKFPLQAMMTNRMLREGSSRMTSSEIAEKLDFYGAWLDLSSSVNNGFITLYSLGKFFDKTIDIPGNGTENSGGIEQTGLSGKRAKGGGNGEKKAEH